MSLGPGLSPSLRFAKRGACAGRRKVNDGLQTFVARMERSEIRGRPIATQISFTKVVCREAESRISMSY